MASRACCSCASSAAPLTGVWKSAIPLLSHAPCNNHRAPAATASAHVVQQWPCRGCWNPSTCLTCPIMAAHGHCIAAAPIVHNDGRTRQSQGLMASMQRVWPVPHLGCIRQDKVQHRGSGGNLHLSAPPVAGAEPMLCLLCATACGSCPTQSSLWVRAARCRVFRCVNWAPIGCSICLAATIQQRDADAESPQGR